MIWKLAVGGLRIQILKKPIRQYRFQIITKPPIFELPAPDCDGRCGKVKTELAHFILMGNLVLAKPNFQLPMICRQMRSEISPFIYNLNTFTFSYKDTIDTWVKNRAPAQLRLITSVDLPAQYMQFYLTKRSMTLRTHFPNIERVGLDIYFVICERGLNETIECCQERLTKVVKESDGDGVKVYWGRTATDDELARSLQSQRAEK